MTEYGLHNITATDDFPQGMSEEEKRVLLIRNLERIAATMKETGKTIEFVSIHPRIRYKKASL